MPSEELTYQFQIEPAQLVRASSAVTRRAQRPGPTLALMAVALAPIAFAVVTEQVDRVLPPYLLVVTTIGLLSLGVMWLHRFRLRRQVTETPLMRGVQSYRLTVDHLECTSELGFSSLRWEAITEAAETEEFFLFYFVKDRAYFLPKAVVGGPLEEERLRAFLRARLGPRARLEDPVVPTA